MCALLPSIEKIASCIGTGAQAKLALTLKKLAYSGCFPLTQPQYHVSTLSNNACVVFGKFTAQIGDRAAASPAGPAGPLLPACNVLNAFLLKLRFKDQLTAQNFKEMKRSAAEQSCSAAFLFIVWFYVPLSRSRWIRTLTASMPTSIAAWRSWLST